MLITPEQLAEWKRLVQEATEGPWEAEYYHNGNYINRAGSFFEQIVQDGIPERGDTDFIVMAREAVPALIAEVERLQSAMKNALEDLNHIALRDIDGGPWISPYAVKLAASHLTEEE